METSAIYWHAETKQNKSMKENYLSKDTPKFDGESKYSRVIGFRKKNPMRLRWSDGWFHLVIQEITKKIFS